MDMKISVEFDLSSFVESWGDDTLESVIKEDIKHEALKRVKASPEYKAIIEAREHVMMNSLHKL